MRLTFAAAVNDRTRPLLERTVRPDGIDLAATVGHPADIFYRQLRDAPYDVSEMSLSSLLIVISQGNSDWVALPVFPVRHFFHCYSWVSVDSGIERPEDLSGKRIGVPEYQMTAALWARGALQHEFGVHPTAVEWYMERTPEKSHAGATGFRPPEGVKLNYIPSASSIVDLLHAGELDATLVYMQDPDWLGEVVRTTGGADVDRSGGGLEHSERARRLFPDPLAEARRYYAATGILPVNHTIVVRRSIVEADPWVASALLTAFEASKQRALETARTAARARVALGALPPEYEQAFAVDDHPYGMEANRHVLETLAEYSYEQGLTSRLVPLEEVFFEFTPPRTA